MTRKRLTSKARAGLFEAHGGRCHMCLGKIQAGEAWEVSHPIPLAAGGDDVESNRAPAHKKCHGHHTATVDAPLIAKTRRQHQKHIGAFKSSRPMPGSKASRFRKLMNGTVLIRSE